MKKYIQIIGDTGFRFFSEQGIIYFFRPFLKKRRKRLYELAKALEEKALQMMQEDNGIREKELAMQKRLVKKVSVRPTPFNQAKLDIINETLMDRLELDIKRYETYLYALEARYLTESAFLPRAKRKEQKQEFLKQKEIFSRNIKQFKLQRAETLLLQLSKEA